MQDVAGGPPTPVTGGRTSSLPKLGRPVSPDGRRVVALGPDGIPALYPLAGGEPVAVPGLGEDDVPLCWTPDGRELMVARYEETPPRIERVEVASGRARPWNRLGRSAAQRPLRPVPHPGDARRRVVRLQLPARVERPVPELAAQVRASVSELDSRRTTSMSERRRACRALRASLREPASGPTRWWPSSARAAWARSTAPATSGSRATWLSRSSTPTSRRTPSGCAASSTRRKAAGSSTIPTSSPSTTSARADGAPYIGHGAAPGRDAPRRGSAASPLASRKAVDFALQIVRGLAAAHEKGIVHRDLKPENLFLTQRRAREDPRLRHREARAGRRGRGGTDVEASSPDRPRAPARCWARSATCPPSRCAASRSDHRSDLFSLGACSSRC